MTSFAPEGPAGGRSGGSAAAAEEFRSAMRALAGGVVIVSCWIEDRPWGLTVTSCGSVSVEPPTVLLSLASGCTSRTALAAGSPFGINILHADQRRVAEVGARVGAPKFIDGHHDEPASAAARSPVVAGAESHLDCSVTHSWDVEDHTIFIGSVDAVSNWHRQHGREPNPLVYLNRSYRRVGPQVPVEPPRGESM